MRPSSSLSVSAREKGRARLDAFRKQKLKKKSREEEEEEEEEAAPLSAPTVNAVDGIVDADADAAGFVRGGIEKTGVLDEKDAVCGKKYYLSSTRAEVMKREAEANGLIEYIDNYDSITKGNAHMGCWRKIRNDAVKEKERREEEALRNRARNMSAEEWHAELEDLMKEAEEIMARMNVQR